MDMSPSIHSLTLLPHHFHLYHLLAVMASELWSLGITTPTHLNIIAFAKVSNSVQKQNITHNDRITAINIWATTAPIGPSLSFNQSFADHPAPSDGPNASLIFFYTIVMLLKLKAMYQVSGFSPDMVPLFSLLILPNMSTINSYLPMGLWFVMPRNQIHMPSI